MMQALQQLLRKKRNVSDLSEVYQQRNQAPAWLRT